MELREGTCRLCLKTCGSSSEIIGESHQKSLSLLLLNLDLAISHEPVMCKNCSGNLQKFFVFKTACLFVEDSVVAFANKQYSVQVDLRKLYPQAPDNLNVCRFCMKITEYGSFIFFSDEHLDVLLLKTMVEKYFPEMDLKITKDPVICMICYEYLDNYFNFVIGCLTVEEKLKKYSEVAGMNSRGTTELNKVLHPTLQGTLTNKNNGLNISKLEDTLREDGRENCVEVNVKRKNSNRSESKWSNQEHCKLNKEIRNDVTKNEHNESQNDNIELEIKVENVVEIEENWYEDVLVKTEGVVKTEEEDGNSAKTDIKEDKNSCEEKKGYIVITDEQEVKRRQKAFELLQQSFRSQREYLLLSNSEIRKMITREWVSGIKMYKCKICGYITKRKSCMNEHMLVHQDPSKRTQYQCSICSQNVRCNSQLRIHMKRAHKDPSQLTKYKCEVCGYETPFKYYLKGHIRVHKSASELKMFECHTCSFKTKYKHSITKHVLLHMRPDRVPKTYKCAFCFYQTEFKSRIDLHVVTHRHPSETTMFRCYLCPYEAKFKSSITEHLQTHRDPQKCKYCKYTSKNVKAFKKHVSLHQ